MKCRVTPETCHRFPKTSNREPSRPTASVLMWEASRPSSTYTYVALLKHVAHSEGVNGIPRAIANCKKPVEGVDLRVYGKERPLKRPELWGDTSFCCSFTFYYEKFEI